MPDSIAGAIDFVRLIIEAINNGRIEARTISTMTDEQIVEYITKLQADAQAEVDRGNQIDP